MTPAQSAIVQTCDPRLQRIVAIVDQHYPCVPLEGRRSLEQQKRNVAKGVSKTLASKHVQDPALAIDIAPAPLLWPDDPKIADDPKLPDSERKTRRLEREVRWKRFHVFAGYFMGVAATLGEDIRWGGDWDKDWNFVDQQFHDLPHFELVTP